MNKRIVFFSLVTVASTSLFVSPVFADSTTVTIHNDVNTSSSNTSSSNCHTVVTTIINGKEQDIESDDCNHDINMNGVHISNNTGGTVIITPHNSEPSTTISPLVTPDISSEEARMRMDQKKLQEKMEQEQKDMHAKQENLWQRINTWFHNFFSGKFFQ